jgi:hypothetical protein
LSVGLVANAERRTTLNIVGIINHLAPAGWRAMSAGSHPTGQVHPRALPIPTLARDKAALKAAMDRIATLTA